MIATNNIPMLPKPLQSGGVGSTRRPLDDRSALAYDRLWYGSVGVRPGSERGFSRPSHGFQVDSRLSGNAPSGPAPPERRGPREVDPGD
jgi:hypothetical protein